MLSTRQINLLNPTRSLQRPLRINIRNRPKLTRHVTTRSINNLTPRTKRDNRYQRQPQGLPFILLTRRHNRQLRQYHLIPRRPHQSSSHLRINAINHNRNNQIKMLHRRHKNSLISPLINTLNTRSNNRRRLMQITRIRFTIHIQMSLLRSSIRDTNPTRR